MRDAERNWEGRAEQPSSNRRSSLSLQRLWLSPRTPLLPFQPERGDRGKEEGGSFWRFRPPPPVTGGRSNRKKRKTEGGGPGSISRARKAVVPHERQSLSDHPEEGRPLRPLRKREGINSSPLPIPPRKAKEEGIPGGPGRPSLTASLFCSGFATGCEGRKKRLAVTFFCQI